MLPKKCEVDALMKEFRSEFERKLVKAYASGALSGEESPEVVLRCVLVIAASGFKPLHPDSRKLLSNLECFI